MVSRFERAVGPKTLVLESGKLAQQAGGSVVISYGDNVVLATATMSKPRPGIDFFPLTIDVEERLYARGKIPGSFFRREGRPTTHATLMARLTDRPIRPLFPKGFRNEVQVVVTTLSTDLENPLDLITLIGASAALSISDIPFQGPIGATRIGYVDGEFVTNPTYAQLDESKLDLIVAGSRGGVLMMEAAADQVPEDIVLEAIQRAQEVNQEVIALQDEIVSTLGKPKAAFEETSYPEELGRRVEATLGSRLSSTFDSSNGKDDRESSLDEIRAELIQQLGEEYDASDIKGVLDDLLEKEFRNRILNGGSRPDGRGLRDIRPLSSEVGLLPRAHGSGLFSRGETQILGVATLGSVGDAKRVDDLSPEKTQRFMLHYNFPPYSTGEVKRMMGAGRREIGHGALAEKALRPVIPSEEEFPYTLRVVCEALSSNGSTSMASVCAGTLALMDAGVPIDTPVAGISVGLITGDGGRYATLTDIQGIEDHTGDMDFKVAGTATGITAIQLDIKVNNIGFDVIKDALEQAREARMFVLDRMRETIGETRSEMSPYAPRMVRITIPVDKIGAVIGPGGKMIRSIVEETKATVDVQDDGGIIIGSTDAEASRRAIEMIENLTREAKVGEIYTGKVVRIMGFGAFVQILPGKDGLVHISELADHHVPSVEDVVSIGEEITVVVTEIDQMGRINLSRRALLQSESGDGASGDAEGTPGQPAGAAGGPGSGERRPFQRREGPGGGGRGGYRPQGPRPGGQRGPRSGPGAPGPRRPR